MLVVAGDAVEVLRAWFERGRKKEPRPRPGLTLVGQTWLGLGHVHGIGTFRALLNFEVHVVALVEELTRSGLVHEDVLTTTIGGDETETLLRVEELNYSTCHTACIVC
jgi:hypothetical protein